jgi:hypothetical protein
LHGQDHEKHNERTHNKGIHLQHAHKHVNARPEERKEKKIKTANKTISPQSKN